MFPEEASIELDTPPPSPTRIWEDDLWAPGSCGELGTLGDYHISSPQKRPRTYTVRSRKSKKSRGPPLEASDCLPLSSEEICGPQVAYESCGSNTGDTAPAKLTTNPTTFHALSLAYEDGKSREHPRGYLEYMESVAAGIAGIYLLSSNLFVVQGWDSRSLTATVSYGCNRTWDETMIQLTLHTRMHGIICSGRRSASKRSLSVSVPEEKMAVYIQPSCTSMAICTSQVQTLIHVSTQDTMLS